MPLVGAMMTRTSSPGLVRISIGTTTPVAAPHRADEIGVFITNTTYDATFAAPHRDLTTFPRYACYLPMVS
jgi:hypothetical protein